MGCLSCLLLLTQQPDNAAAWYALGQTYTDVSNQAARTFGDRPDDAAWRRLLAADALLANGRMVDAFALYRDALDALPSMVSVHDSIARIYERSGHADWAARERAAVGAVDCAARRAMCEFRAGRLRESLDATRDRTDAESRYWRARAAGELARAAFARLDDLPDSVERRGARAARARAEERPLDAIVELEAALKLAPGHPALTYELAAACYAARDYERALATLATLTPMINAAPDNGRALTLAGYSLLRLRRLDEAIPMLQRALERTGDPALQLALGRAYVQNGSYAAAIPVLEPQLAGDDDGSLHAQLARAYAGVGQRDRAAALLATSAELQRAADRRAAASAQRTITAPR